MATRRIEKKLVQEVREMKEKMEVEVRQHLESREVLLNQRESELTALQVPKSSAPF